MSQTLKYHHFSASSPAVWLVDNGSLRAQSVLALRAQAAQLAQSAGVAVDAVSVLHSSKIPAAELGGVPAAVFTSRLRASAAAGLRRLLVLPYFFGPSAALTEYLPQQIARVRQEYPELQVRIAPPLVDLADLSDPAPAQLASFLARQVGTLAGSRSLPVVLVDHGSPQPEVSAVRNRVGEALAPLLEGKARDFAVCSMEAREGPQYAHTLPLLEQVLERPPFCDGLTVLAPLFLSPGRHAGEGGDLWQIAQGVRERHPALRVAFCQLPGGSAQVTEILLRRLRSGLSAFA